MKTTTNPKEITLVSCCHLCDGMMFDDDGYVGFDPEECIGKLTSDNVITADNFSYDDEDGVIIYEGDEWNLDFTNVGERNDDASEIKTGDYVFERGGSHIQIFRLGAEQEFVESNDTYFGSLLGTKKGVIEYLKIYYGDMCDEQGLTENQAKEILNTCIDYINNMDGVL